VLIAFLSALGTLANPFTYHLHFFIVEHLFLGEVIQIAEHVSVFGLGFTFYWIVAGVSVFALVRLWPKRRWAEILLILAFGLFSMKSHRTTPVFAILAAPVIARGLRARRPGLGKAVKRKVASLVATAALLAVALGGQIYPQYYQRSGVPPLGFGLYEPRYPIEAVAFVEKHNLPDPLYNEYDFGGYLIWKWYPRRKVFQDGRTLVYDREFFRAVYGAKKAEEWRELMETYGVKLAMVSSQLEANFTHKFVKDRWALLYWDEVAAVMLKRLPAHHKLVDRYEYRLLQPFLTGSEVETIVKGGQGKELENELQRHLELHPDSPRARALAGWKLLADGKPPDALQTFEEVLRIHPGLFQANWGAARSLTALGQEERAKLYWRKLLKLGAKGSLAAEARRGVGR
jgi:tetratricopeptide (TPR) repeat protein